MNNPRKHKIHFGLLPRIIIAIGAGIGFGYIMPEWLVRTASTFNMVFGELLGFLIPLIIIGFVAPAIADLGGRAGRMLLFTALLAYVASVGAGLISYFTGEAIFPHLLTPGSVIATGSGITALSPYFTMSIPAVCGVMTALALAFMLGIGASKLDTGVLRHGLDEFRKIVNMAIRSLIIPLLPYYIFGIFVNMTYTGQAGIILRAFVSIIAVIFALHIGILLLQFCIASLFAKNGISRNPLKLLWAMMPAYFTALGTQSSAATIPVTLERTIRMGVDEDVAGFTVPLCATIHMSGSILKLVACALALMILHGMPYDTAMFAGFTAMLGVTIVAAPGVPGGAVMAALGLFTSMLGFSEADNALMIALYITMDSFGTACNVTGDGALAIIVNRFFGKRSPTPTPARDTESR